MIKFKAHLEQQLFCPKFICVIASFRGATIVKNFFNFRKLEKKRSIRSEQIYHHSFQIITSFDKILIFFLGVLNFLTVRNGVEYLIHIHIYIIDICTDTCDIYNYRRCTRTRVPYDLMLSVNHDLARVNQVYSGVSPRVKRPAGQPAPRIPPVTVE